MQSMSPISQSECRASSQFLCLHNFYFAAKNIEGATSAAVLWGAVNVGLFVTLPQVFYFAVNPPLRRYAAKKLKNVLPSKFVLNQSRSRVSPMAQRNQDEVESQGIEMEERPADPTRHM